MRVVHISKVTGIAGSEKHLLNLLPALKDRGVEVSIIALLEAHNPVSEFMARWQALGIDATPMPIYHHLDVTVIMRLARALRRLKPDIVHTHLMHADLYGVLAARLVNVDTVISTRHNDDPFRRRFLFRLQTRALDRIVGHYISISEWLQRFAVEVEQLPAGKVTTVHYGLPSESFVTSDGGAASKAVRESFGIAADAPLIVVVARLVEQKGIGFLIEAFRRVASKLPDARLLVVGDGPLRAKLMQETVRLDLAQAVHFAGWRDDAVEFMAASNIVVVPSLWEGFGLVALEAMACARPIVASSVSALPEIVVDGETGWLVPPRDADALADALLQALRRPDIAVERGQNGRRRLIDTFSVERMVDKTLDVYKQVLRQRDAA